SFASFLFLSLAFAKRASELHNLRQLNVEFSQGRSYRTNDLEQITLFGVASGFLASVVLTLYINSEQVRTLYDVPEILWFLFLVFLYWICRIWIICARGELHEDPILFALNDRVTYYIAAVSAAILALATTNWLSSLRFI